MTYIFLFIVQTFFRTLPPSKLLTVPHLLPGLIPQGVQTDLPISAHGLCAYGAFTRRSLGDRKGQKVFGNSRKS